MPAVSGRFIYVVFAASAHASTGAQLAQQVVAIQEDRKAAERLEADYAALADEADRVSRRVFIQRFPLPYSAPAVKDLISRG